MKEVVSKVVSKGKAAGVLRLAFHDAGTFEMDENSGIYIGGYDVLGKKIFETVIYCIMIIGSLQRLLRVWDL